MCEEWKTILEQIDVIENLAMKPTVIINLRVSGWLDHCCIFGGITTRWIQNHHMKMQYIENCHTI